MGVARDFVLLGLNAREFRRAGLNPRWWLGRRVNQSATDAVGGVAIFCVKRRDPLPAGCPRPFAGQRGPPLIRGPPISTAAGPSPTAWTPSLHCRDPSSTIPPSVAAGIHRRGPPPSVAADPLSLSPRTSSLRRRGPPLTAVD
ncbi:hypothetical protein niasHT_038705 [Heterodera trifolii]|uniref:Uncharacterized protein n=1 Tax=Heterodera trifolii TaxID=157864 RepID=A0ABD2I2N8_9BILA